MFYGLELIVEFYKNPLVQRLLRAPAQVPAPYYLVNKILANSFTSLFSSCLILPNLGPDVGVLRLPPGEKRLLCLGWAPLLGGFA